MKLVEMIKPINSLIFISDPNGGEPPEPVRGAQVLSTPSCISVICFPEQDGPTELSLGDAADVDPGWEPVFEGQLVTPNRAVCVSTAVHEKLLETPTATTKTRIRVWISHPRWPERVIVGFDQPT